MKLSLATLGLIAFATQTVVADGWFGKTGRTAYNKWHQTELERWLSDNNVPYPTPADRKDLENLMKENWDDKISKPYNSWDTHQLSNYLSSKGHEVKKGTEKNKNSLIEQVQGLWYDSSDKASSAYENVSDWIFDSWTESQLKSFLDYHNIPNPTPRTRDSLLHTARANYQKAADKVGETAHYPGDWLYHSWSDSDLKLWADERGIPVPQPSSRDKLIASIRRNSKVAGDSANSKFAQATNSAAAAQSSLSDQLLNSWSDSQLKEWFDKNGIKVPQGSNTNELKALARKNAAKLSGDNVASSASSMYGAATSSAGNTYAQATDNAYGGFQYYYDWAMAKIGMGSEEAKASLSSVSVSASSSLSSASSVASSEASKSSSSVSKSGKSGASAASKSGKSGATAATDAATEAASSVKNRAGEAYQRATDKVKEEL